MMCASGQPFIIFYWPPSFIRTENDRLEKETAILTKHLKRVDPKDVQNAQIKGRVQNIGLHIFKRTG